MILHDMGHEILVVDTSEERVQKMLPYATNGLVADTCGGCDWYDIYCSDK